VADWGSDLLLEAPFDVGRWLVRRALAAHWEGRATRPPAGEYILRNDLLWQFAAPVVAPEIAALVAEGDAAESLSADEAEEVVESLLGEPSFRDWALPVRPFAETLVNNFGEGNAVTTETMARHILRQMDGGAAEIREWLRDSLREGLRAQAVWLHAAGRPGLAMQTARLARKMIAWPPSQNPLLYALLLRGLQQGEE
jgi:hypothetical protein